MLHSLLLGDASIVPPPSPPPVLSSRREGEGEGAVRIVGQREVRFTLTSGDATDDVMTGAGVGNEIDNGSFRYFMDERGTTTCVPLNCVCPKT